MKQRGFAIMLGLVAALGLGAGALGQPPTAPQPFVDKLVLADTIQPVTAGELKQALAKANADGAEALLIELDTPGGLLDSTRAMAGAILSSRVQVIVYVSPEGARAGSAGFFLLESADIAAMAAGTNAGAAHPVIELGPQPDATMSQKIENDAEAFLRSYVTRRGRNAAAAEEAVHSSHSYTAQEALDQHLIDVVANNDWELLHQLEGREITRLDGSKLTLRLANARVDYVRPTLRDELLDWLVNPNVALLFLVCGALLIYLEFNMPGTILLLEAKFGGHGVLAVAGIVCLTFGTLTLVAAPVPEMAISPWAALAVSAGFGGITVFLVRLAIRARRRKALVGPDALEGCTASAMEVLAPEGHVLVEGEIWQAVASKPIPAGAAVRVVGHEEYLLHVEPVEAGGNEKVS